MKIRAFPSLKALLDAAAFKNKRPLNAEVIARLQWSFDHGYDAQAQTAAIQKQADELVRATPLIQMDKRLTDEIEILRATVRQLEGRMSALEGKVSAITAENVPETDVDEISTSARLLMRDKT